MILPVSFKNITELGGSTRNSGPCFSPIPPVLELGAMCVDEDDDDDDDEIDEEEEDKPFPIIFTVWAIN